MVEPTACRMDADLNNFDSFHETYRHQNLKPGEWTALYREAWDTFYSKENMVNTLLRCPRERYWQLFRIFVWYRSCALAHTHPMITGLVRLKDRKARRPIFPMESRARYAWRRTREMAAEARLYLKVFLEFQEIWMLTRPEDDPRWAALAELRARWTDARNRLREFEIAGHCEEAATELRTLLQATSERLHQMSQSGLHLGGRARRGLARKAQEAEAYLQRFEVGLPDWQRIRQAQRFVGETLVAGYEDVAIRYVAKRRHFNDYRRDLLQRIKEGRFLPRDIAVLPRALLFELVFGVRFSLSYITGA
jgi:hypothetical protein